MVPNATFNNISVISWRSVLLVKETGVPGENHWSVASHWQNLSYNVVSSTAARAEYELMLVVIGIDCIVIDPTNIR
jgi:hypothetical protein